MSNTRRAIMLNVFCLGVLVSFSLPVHAREQIEWGEPVAVGPDLPSSWFPEINADATGKVRLVWSASLTTEDANVTHVANGGVMIAELGAEGWTPPSDIYVLDGGIASRPIIASDGAYAHLLFRRGSGVSSAAGTGDRLFYMRAPLSADLSNAHSWSEPWPLSEGWAYWAQLVTLPDGSLVTIFNQMTDVMIKGKSEKRTALFSRRSSDRGQTWSALVRVSETEDRVARTSLAVTPDGTTLIAAWDEGYDNISGEGDPTAVSTAFSHDGGQTWSKQRFRVRAQQSIVATGGTATVLIYRSTVQDELLFRTSEDQGQSWSDEQVIPNAIPRPYTNKHNFEKLSAAFDGDGRLLLAYVGTDPDAPKGLSVMVTTYAGGEWSMPQVVARPDGYPEYPRLAVALGNQIHLVYFVRDNQIDLGHYTLWSITGQSGAQAVPAAVVDPAPAPTATSVTAATPTPIPVPTVPPAPAPLLEVSDERASPQTIVSRPMIFAVIVTGLALLVIPALLLLSRTVRRLGI